MVRVSRRVGWVADIAADPLRPFKNESRSPPWAARCGWGALRTVRPGRQPRRERGGPVPAPPAKGGREGAARYVSTTPGSGEYQARGRCKARGRSREPPSPRTLPSRPGAGRGAPPTEEMRPAGAGQRRGVGPARRSSRTERPSLTRRVESPGRTARTPPVYLSTVSRPLELSLQSSFQLSLKVLVDYRSRAGI